MENWKRGVGEHIVQSQRIPSAVYNASVKYDPIGTSCVHVKNGHDNKRSCNAKVPAASG